MTFRAFQAVHDIGMAGVLHSANIHYPPPEDSPHGIAL